MIAACSMTTPFDPPQQQPPFPDSPPPRVPETTTAATLLVRHLPEAVPRDLLSRLFSYYGASSFRPCSAGRLRNCAFVDFKDESAASHAQSLLNRLRFHKKVLSVERVSNGNSAIGNQSSGVRSSTDPPSRTLSQSDVSVAGKPTEGATMSSVPCCEPIAPRLGVDFPFPPHLEYDYPPPDGNILTNIVNALIAVPRFYTQVLHLMNKMNIPAPFRMALPTPPLPPPVPAPPPPPPPHPPSVLEKPPPADLSSEESELESSEDDVPDAVQSRKRAKREAILGPAVDKGVAHEDVGLKPAALVPKEVAMIKKKNPILQIKIASKPAKNETKDGGSSLTGIVEQSEDMRSKPYATPEDIENGKLPPEEILSLPMFKNYAAGNPAMVLYVKNLAKDVVTDDFYYVFGSLFGSSETVRSSLNVKLMQEGRMRGQAFVTFPSIDLAHRALNLVNGYVFKGKPMIIQFGRNPAATKAS